MSIAIRPACADDIAAMVAIEDAVFETDKVSLQSFRRMVSGDTAAVLVADDAGAVAGYCVVLFRSYSRKGRLYSIAVEPGRSGIGRMLLAAAEAEALRRGCAALRLEVSVDNPRAIALYEKAGYLPDGEMEDYYADGGTARRYIKPLAAAQPAGRGTLKP